MSSNSNTSTSTAEEELVPVFGSNPLRYAPRPRPPAATIPSLTELLRPRLPEGKLYLNAAKAPLAPCPRCGKGARSGICPDHCKSHRNNIDPEFRWVHITNYELELINTIRHYRFHERVADLLDAIAITEDGASTIDDSESVAMLTDSARAMALDSGDEL